MMLSKIAVFAAIAVCVSASHVAGLPFNGFNRRQHNSVKEVTFTPHELPCSHRIKTEIYSNDTSACPKGLCGFVLLDVRGNFLRLEEQTYYRNESYYAYVRPDINYTEDETLMVAVYSTFYVEDFRVGDQGECHQAMGSMEDVKQELLKGFEFVYETAEYDHVEDSEFSGVKCKKYTYDEVDYFSLYATDDNYIIAYITVDEGSERTVRFSYTLKTPLDTFTVQESEIADCNSTAYEKPKWDACEDESSSSTSTMIKAVLSMVIFTISFALVTVL